VDLVASEPPSEKFVHEKGVGSGGHGVMVVALLK
jgi:hypothetical protein